MMERMTLEKRNQVHKNKAGGTGPSKLAVLSVILLAVAAIFAIAVFSIAGNTGQASGRTNAPSATPVPEKDAKWPEGDRKITGILEGVDTAAGTLKVYSVEDAETFELSYVSATDIRDKYGLAIVAGQLSAGDILQVTYESKTMKVAAAAISPNTWEYVRQSGLLVAQGRDIIAVGGNNYAYSEALHVYDRDVRSELGSLSKKDTFTMRGIGNEVYVILLTRGHGYLSLKEDQDYIGGSLFLNLDMISQITEGMLLEVTEGSYEVTIENGDLSAKLPTVIKRGETTVLNLAEYAREPDPVGWVAFRIQPEGAMLWVDDAKTYYNLPVELDYGIHQVRVELGGYVSYEGSLTVNSASMTVGISLVENAVEGGDNGEWPNYAGEEDPEGGNLPDDGSGSMPEGGDVPDKQDTPVGGGNPDNTSETPSGDAYGTDDDHYIIIYSDEEVEIYLDDDYMGVIEDGEAAFEKYIGSFTLRLIKGDEEKSYIIQVDDDGEDFVFRRYFD